MMENRSFDHMLGYLGLPANSRYEGVRGRHTNPLAGRSTPARLRPAREVIPNPVTRIPYSPEHGQSHVKDQIADGAMSGFAQDFENSHPGFGEYVMTYYTGEDLKCYDLLARQHGVCDHWFSAFPGGTWPNRWTTLSGRTPELTNLAIDDSRIGFLEGETIFETLTRYNIDWRLFESDLSLIRTYNRYRLDTQHVLPFDNRRDKSMGFVETAAREGGLPAVTFVEPNFRDIPPLSTANDDLAPADLLRGQAFIQRVVNALRANLANWSKTLLIITYDEHGGFFDHVPPPGTTGGPDAWEGRVPRLHPEGPDFMGVRVPALIVSPLVTPGSVCKQVFDHTSIIKTILLRHRRRFETSVFTKFGPRVNIAADLGLALTGRTPQTETFAALPRIATTRRPARAEPPDPGTQVIRRNDFHESLRRGFLPTRK
jgi:phospholipase C